MPLAIRYSIYFIELYILVFITGFNLSRYRKYMGLMRKQFFAMSLSHWKAGLNLFILELLLKLVRCIFFDVVDIFEEHSEVDVCYSGFHVL